MNTLRILCIRCYKTCRLRLLTRLTAPFRQSGGDPAEHVGHRCDLVRVSRSEAGDETFTSTDYQGAGVQQQRHFRFRFADARSWNRNLNVERVQRFQRLLVLKCMRSSFRMVSDCSPITLFNNIFNCRFQIESKV